jgi:hypothetical protein
MPLETPIVLVCYRRPEQTQRVLDRLKEVEPTNLYVAADGPRHRNEWSAVRATRKLFENIGWDCEVRLDFSERNLGLALRVTSAVSSAFQHYDEVIVLEDDIVPDASFFMYCSEMLDRYRSVDRVMQICGTCFTDVGQVAESSYSFTQLASPGGFATWKRVWESFDASYFRTSLARLARILPISMRWVYARPGLWQEVTADEALLQRIMKCGKFYTRWLAGSQTRSLPNSWAGSFALWVVKQNGLVATPFRNLVKNTGFGEFSTHFPNAQHDLANRETLAMSFPLQHPARVELDLHFQRKCAKVLDHALLSGNSTLS